MPSQRLVAGDPLCPVGMRRGVAGQVVEVARFYRDALGCVGRGRTGASAPWLAGDAHCGTRSSAQNEHALVLGAIDGGDDIGLERHLIDRQTYKERRSAALAEWLSVASQAAALKDRSAS